MSAGFAVSLIFLCFSVAALLFMIFTKNELIRSFRRYYIMGAAVYLSGTVIISVFYLIVDLLPVIFAVIAEVCILSVFLVSTWAIGRMGKAVKEINEHNEKQRAEAEEKLPEDN